MNLFRDWVQEVTRLKRLETEHLFNELVLYLILFEVILCCFGQLSKFLFALFAQVSEESSCVDTAQLVLGLTKLIHHSLDCVILLEDRGLLALACCGSSTGSFVERRAGEAAVHPLQRALLALKHSNLLGDYTLNALDDELEFSIITQRP